MKLFVMLALIVSVAALPSPNLGDEIQLDPPKAIETTIKAVVETKKEAAITTKEDAVPEKEAAVTTNETGAEVQPVPEPAAEVDSTTSFANDFMFAVPVVVAIMGQFM